MYALIQALLQTSYRMHAVTAEEHELKDKDYQHTKLSLAKAEGRLLYLESFKKRIKNYKVL